MSEARGGPTPPLRRPRIDLLSLGGTIAMTPSGDDGATDDGASAAAGGGVTPKLQAKDLVAAVPQLADVADLRAESFRLVPGAHLTPDDVVSLAAEIRKRLGAGAAGVVVTQGTDTMEEVAFALDCLLGGKGPVMVTGAMRPPLEPGADGPANLLAAVTAAADPQLHGAGVCVVMNDEIHSAYFVQKRHATSPAAFSSFPAGPVGWLSEGRAVVAGLPVRRVAAIAAKTPVPPVALYTASLGDDGRLLDGLVDAGYAGLVVDALGGGHVPVSVRNRLARLAEAMPVVYASRTGAGAALEQTYGFPGSETDLQKCGLISAGPLPGAKARVLLALMLASDGGRDSIAAAFREALPFGQAGTT